jgi:hypothetical protein
LFVLARSGPVLVLAPLLAVLTLAGCGPKKTATPAPSPATTAPGRGSSSAVQGGAGAAKTCTAGHTQAIINGRPKCLAAGQTCSSKAISQYPQYGFVCLTSNGRLTLRRK